MKGNRIEKIVTIEANFEPCDKYPGCGRAVDLKDEDGNNYEWNTVT